MMIWCEYIHLGH